MSYVINDSPDADVIPHDVVMDCLVKVYYIDWQDGYWKFWCQFSCNLADATAFLQDYDDWNYLGISSQGEHVYRVWIANAPSELD